MIEMRSRDSADVAAFSVRPWTGVGATGLDVAGELDLATAPAFLGALASALHPRPARLSLGLGRVSFMDARCAGAIVTASAHMGAWGGTLTVLEPRAAVRRVFELCGADDLLARCVANAPTRPARQLSETPVA